MAAGDVQPRTTTAVTHCDQLMGPVEEKEHTALRANLENLPKGSRQSSRVAPASDNALMQYRGLDNYKKALLQGLIRASQDLWMALLQ